MVKYNASPVLLFVGVLLFCLPIFTLSKPAPPLLLLDLDLDLDSPSPSTHEHQHSFTSHSTHHKPSPPSHHKSKRAWVRFSNPPDITKGVAVFWETSKNVTIIAGQFSAGFVEGEEKEYTFKVYQDSEEILDLKPSEDSFDKLLKIREDGSTDLFLFTIEDRLISGRDGIVDTTLVIGRPGVLLGKNRIVSLSCN